MKILNENRWRLALGLMTLWIGIVFLKTSTTSNAAPDGSEKVRADAIRQALQDVVSEETKGDSSFSVDADAKADIDAAIDQAVQRFADGGIDRLRLENLKGRFATILHCAAKIDRIIPPGAGPEKKRLLEINFNADEKPKIKPGSVQRVLKWLCPGFWPFC